MPRTQLERLVAELWCSLLKIDSAAIDDDFFELGGDSLAAMRFAARVAKETGMNVNVRAVFDHPTIRDFAVALSEDIASEPIPRRSGRAL